jgi:hypothetical protein
MESDARAAVAAVAPVPAVAPVTVQVPAAARRAMESDARAQVAAASTAGLEPGAPVPHGARAALEAEMGQ